MRFFNFCKRLLLFLTKFSELVFDRKTIFKVGA